MCPAKMRTSVLLALGYLCYLLAGAAVFQTLEQQTEHEVKNSTQHYKLDFLRNFTCLNKEAVERLVEVIIEAAQQGIYPLANESLQAEHSNWDFSSSFFFVGSIVTTIGYGTLAPRTAGGQIFCVFYALLGIPLNIIVLGHVSKTLSLLCERLGRCLSNQGMEKKKVKLLTMLFFLVTGIIAFLGIPPIFFMKMEGWNYREGIYYAFISLSTIGFGDYVVGSHPDRKYYRYYRALVAIWIIFGLAWLALLFNLLTACLEDTEKKIAKDFHKKVKASKRKERVQNAVQRTNSDSAKDGLLLDSCNTTTLRDTDMADPSSTGQKWKGLDPAPE